MPYFPSNKTVQMIRRSLLLAKHFFFYGFNSLLVSGVKTQDDFRRKKCLMKWEVRSSSSSSSFSSFLR
jgi:hypothetical protein